MRTVTALRPERRGRVRIELDGEPWRTVPAAAVASAGLRVDGTLDRERARALRRALRRLAAVDAAARALTRHDRSAADLRAHLERRGIGAPEREEAVAAMARLGYLDDRRLASARAATLAGRGYGDEAIRCELAGRGLAAEAVRSALAGIEPEHERARALAARSTARASLARALQARGFSPEALDAAGLGGDEVA
jgi:SOS response regulatory protein OraA/RecX